MWGRGAAREGGRDFPGTPVKGSQRRLQRSEVITGSSNQSSGLCGLPSLLAYAIGQHTLFSSTLPVWLSGDTSGRGKASKGLGVQLLHLSERKQAQKVQGHAAAEAKIWIPTQSLAEAAWVKAGPPLLLSSGHSINCSLADQTVP